MKNRTYNYYRNRNAWMANTPTGCAFTGSMTAAKAEAVLRGCTHMVTLPSLALHHLVLGEWKRA